MTTLRILEDVSDVDWPAAPSGISTAAAAIAPAVIWRRLEAWIAWRWGPRPCSFIVEGGCGDWRAPLTPFAVTTMQAWDGNTWAAASLQPEPLGGVALGGATHYRLAGTLGADEEPPADVLEAYRRLAEYATDKDAHPSLSARTVELGEMRESFERAPTWLARAIGYSGAADLLRPYRRAP